MRNSFTRIGSLCVASMVLLTSLSGCGGSKSSEATKTESSQTTTTEAKGQNYWEMLDSVQDTSDLPDWTGKQIKLVEWVGHGSGSADHPKPTKDVVSPEVKRVTGVELDADKSFDNGGSSIDVKMGLLAASQDWPDIINTSNTDLVKSLVSSGELYDLTELLPKYCPNVMKLFDTTKYPKIKRNMTANVSDKLFFVPTQAERQYFADLNKDNPDFDMERWSRIQPPSPMCDWSKIWVRDDILKKMYPNAKTQDEIEALYMKNGKFTKEEIFDVPIKTSADFIKFLSDMKILIDKEGIKENGKPVDVSYAFAGGDNWALMSCFLPQVYGLPGGMSYLTYFDKLAGKLVRTVDQSWFKDSVHDYQKLIKAGVISKESLLDNSATFTEKLNSGHYALSYGWLKPDTNALKEAGKKYKYRLLWPEVEYNYEQFSTVMGEFANGLNIGIFKDSVKEEDLPQVLRYLDYMISDVGSKLIFWGPRSAGLFKEENGSRVYTDKELEDNMVYDVDNQRNIYYNLLNKTASGAAQAWPHFPISADANLYHPKYMYNNIVLNAGKADAYFQPGMLTGYSKEEHHVYATQGQNITDFSDQWNVFGKGRDAFEKALTRPLAAKDDAQFESLWQELLKTTDSAGMNEKMMAEMNKIFFEKNPTIVEDCAKISK